MTFASKIFSGLLAFVMFHSPVFGFGGSNGAENNTPDEKLVTVTVAQNGSGDYATLEEARDYVRTLDKSKYDGIDVLIKAGQYTANETFLLTEEDSGTETCHVRYVGEDGAHLYGGVAFTAADFEPLGDGEVVQYFPEDVKDKLVQIDLKQFGFTPEEVKTMVKMGKNCPVSPLHCNGEKMTVARFPNDVPGTTDGWARIKYGHVETDQEIGTCGIKDYQNILTRIEFDEAYNERVHSWHDIYDGLICGRFTYLWFLDNTYVKALCPTDPVMWVQYSACGYEPREGMVFYWYHIPEELDIPGEYYIDKDCVLYYYPTDAHDTAVYTMPTLNDNIITLDNVQYLTIDNLSIESSRRDGISGDADNFTIQNCTVQGVLGNGIRIHGTNITVQNSTVSNVGKSGIHVTGGDIATLTRANNLIYNNYVSNWSVATGVYEMGISSRTSCGTTISHNEICHSVDWAVEVAGAYNTVEYNHIYDVSTFQGDQAVIHVCTTFGGIVRYNYIHDAGINDDYIDFMGISGIDSDFTLGEVETYGNIICNVSGNGELMCNPRNSNVHDNLYISCRKGAVKFTDNWCDTILRLYEPDEVVSYPDDDLPLKSEIWLNEFPWLRDIKLSGTAADLDDPNFWAVPANSSVKNNFIYIDKANCANPSKLTRAYEYWEPCAKFSDIVEPTSDEITVYSSKRSGHPDIREALERASGTINLPYEEFEKIGRVK